MLNNKLMINNQKKGYYYETIRLLFNAYWVSLKTGLPLNASLMGRTSISQTINNVSLVNEPYRPLEILKRCDSEKPFLLLVSECDEMTLPEKKLISKAELITKEERFSLYSLKMEILKNITDSLYINTKSEIANEKLYYENNCFSTDTVIRFVNLPFGDNLNKSAYNSKGCYTGKIQEFNTIFYGSLPNAIPDSDYVFSFWFGKVHHDRQ